jgi:inward rectifier potassium channel
MNIWPNGGRHPHPSFPDRPSMASSNTPMTTPVAGDEPRDLGFGSVVGGANEQRLLNRDGSFNPRRRGLSILDSLSAYHFLLTISWTRFFGIVALGYVAVNVFFALVFVALGPGSLAGVPAETMGGTFGRAFFFSVETLATIGYGNIEPVGLASNIAVAIESLVGLLGFALGTGLLFARFSRPTAAIMFSDRAVVAPYRGATALMFRIANARSNQIIELEAKVQFSRIKGLSRKYDQLTLERTRVVFFPLSWTVVHMIDEKSPLWGFSHQELVEGEAEMLILISGTDETFSQTVHARSSYKPNEITFGHRFVNIYDPIDEKGVVSIDVRRLSDTEPAEADGGWAHTQNWHTTGHFAGFAPPRRGGGPSRNDHSSS